MSHDENHEDDAGDSRAGRQPTVGGVSQGIDEEREGDAFPSDAQPGRAEHAGGIADAVEQELTLADAKTLQQAVSILTGLDVSDSWSGMLPRPKYFAEYPVAVQERICRWNDAFTIDESKRQDKLVDSEIAQARQSLWISAVLFAGSLVMSFIAFILTQSPWSFGFLAVPVMSVIGNMLEPVFSRSSVQTARPKTTKDK